MVKRYEKILDDYKKAVDATTILSTADLKGRIKYANKKFCEISGYSEEELIGKPHSIVRHPDMPKEAFEDMWNTIKAGKMWHGVVKNRAKDGSTYIVDATIIPITDEHGEIEEYVGIRRDITLEYLRSENIEHQLKEQKEEIERITNLDPVTKLPNHQAFCELFQKRDSLTTIVAFRIDHLIDIKDVLGFSYANAYIGELSQTIQTYFEEFGTKIGIYRLDTADLCIVFDGELPNIRKTAEELLQIVKFFYVNYDGIIISSPITIAAYTGSEGIRHKITTLLAYAFDKHRGEYVIGDDKSSCFIDEQPLNIFWFGKYSDAIASEQMLPFFQPILCNKTGKIEKYECLARILDSDKVISPDKFIDLASRAKQIPLLTKAIVRKAFEKFAHHKDLEFSINVSAMDLQDDLLTKQIEYWQNKLNIEPKRVVFEILESEDIYRYGILKKAISSLKDRGFKIAIDDFGTGYSNFIALFEYNFDYIKIDGSLIKKISTDQKMAELVSNLNHFIHMCGAKSVAEFVCDKGIQEVCLRLEIDYSQGYYIGVPSKDLL